MTFLRTSNHNAADGTRHLQYSTVLPTSTGGTYWYIQAADRASFGHCFAKRGELILPPTINNSVSFCITVKMDLLLFLVVVVVVVV